jgi:hypothetical protein
MRWDAKNNAAAKMPALHTLRLKVPALLVVTFFTGCSYVQLHHESLDKFGSAYVAFRKAARDSEIVSWVIVLDQSERTDGNNGTSYRRSFAGALDVTASNRRRADSAEHAVGYYNSNSTKALDDFEIRNDTTHSKFLALVEAANGIGRESHRRQAIAIAESARKIDDAFEAMRKNYAALYDFQIDLLKRIAQENGDLARALPAMQEKRPEKERLVSESNRLIAEEQASERKLQEEYAAFKGTTGITIDYVEPPEAKTNSPSP